MATTVSPGGVFWLHNRTFIVGKVGHKFITGLVVEGGGLKTLKAKVDELRPAFYKGSPYPAPKMRGHLRRMKPLTKSAKKIRTELLA